MRPVQYFTDEYLEQCRAMKPAQILRFLEDFRLLHGRSRPERSRLISLKVPESLLGSFKARAALEGMPYQTQIKRLMRRWLEGDAGQA